MMVAQWHETVRAWASKREGVVHAVCCVHVANSISDSAVSECSFAGHVTLEKMAKIVFKLDHLFLCCSAD